MRSGGVWIHFALLIAAIVGTNTLRSEPESVFRVLYAWMPLLVGVAVAIQPASRKCIGSSLMVTVTAALLMLALDVSGSLPQESSSGTAVLMGGEVRGVGTLSGSVSTSWIRTTVQWVRGELPKPDQHSSPYLAGDPRLVAVEALSELGLLLLCFATTGIVLGVSSWLGSHARFDSRANEAGARVAVAWMVSGGVMFLAVDAVADQRFQVLFGSAALWTVLVPAFGFFALGVAGYVLVYRADRVDPLDPP